MNEENTAAKLAKGIAAVSGIVVAIYSTWLTILAFKGGTAPVFGWNFEGSLGQGLLWLFVLEPLFITVAWWVTLIVLTPLVAVAAASDRRK